MVIEYEKATFAAGCFWNVEVAFRNVEGITDVIVGYTGGNVNNPTYRQVCTGRTGHAEAVRVTFDPRKVSYNDLLKVFFEIHDPTQVNRQGSDVGEQYRSAIFCHDKKQEDAAKDYVVRLEKSKKYKKPIATEVEIARKFWPAEEYHQKYLIKRGLASCRI